MNPLYFIPLLATLAYLTVRNTRSGLYIILATIPGYLLQTKMWFIPTTWLELAIYTVAFVAICKHVRGKTLVPHSFYVMHHIRDYIVPVSVLLIAVLVSILISDTQARAFGILKAWFFAPLLFGVILIDQISVKNLRALLFSISLSAWTIMLYGLYEYSAAAGMTIPGRLDSFFSSPNYVAMYVVPLIVLILGFLITRERLLSVSKKNPLIRGYKLYWMAWLAFALTTLFYTKSFGGWFGLIGGIGFLLLFIPRFSVIKLCVFSGLFMAIMGGFFYLSNRTSFAHVDRFWQISSFQTRKEIWTHSLALVTAHPILGIGLADFSRDYSAYIQTLPISKQPVEKEVLRPHNLFLDLWLETGIAGLIAFLWIIIIFYHRALRRHSSMNTVSVYTGAALFSLIVHGLVDTPYFKNDLALLFWLIIALGSIPWVSDCESSAHKV